MKAPLLLQKLAQELDTELREGILPFWYQTMDRQNGGFFGKVTNDSNVDPTAPKGLVMHARHLWGYSQAYLYRRNPLDLVAAKHAYDYLTNQLYDSGKGFFWIVDRNQEPKTTDKLLYGQGFAIYGLSQFYLATGDKRALALAWETFEWMENRGKDTVNGGYWEAVDRDWIKPVRIALSDVDIPCEKSMNTNLHIMEAYSSLYRATQDGRVRKALEELLLVFRDKIFVHPEHMGLYFDANWNSLTDHVSYGHDIEASWLMTEAAELLYGHNLSGEWKAVFVRVAESIRSLVEEHRGPLINEYHTGHLDTDRVWWVQAECIVGMVNAWQLTQDERYLEAAWGVWKFVQNQLIDKKFGEWYWLVDEKGSPTTRYDKGGLWKTCYHNGRMCIEINQRFLNHNEVKK